MRSSSSESSCTKPIDATREGGDESHHISDQFLLWCPVLLFHDYDELHPIVLEDMFEQAHTKASKSVPVSDEECTYDTSLCETEEASESSTFHVQTRADVSEDQGACLEMASTMGCECVELPVKVTISLLTMS